MVSFQEASFYLFFKINQDYIAKNLCVEKDVQGSKCKGHCHLKKILKQTKESPSSEMPLPSFEPTKIELFVFINNDIEDVLNESVHQSNFVLTSYFDSDFSNSIFHPPIA